MMTNINDSHLMEGKSDSQSEPSVSIEPIDLESLTEGKNENDMNKIQLI